MEPTEVGHPLSGRARIAVIGTGWWATYAHIPALQAHPGAELVALCDTDPDRLRAAADASGVGRTYDDYRTMLEQETLDGVVIATYHATHYPIARDCLLRDLQVMLEKPMTLYASEARELVALARARRRELIIGYPWNYTSSALRAREIITSGALGAVQYVNCVFSSRVVEFLQGLDVSERRPSLFPVHGPGSVYSRPELSGGGQGHLQITHSAGLMFFVTGLRPRQVIARMHRHGLPLDLVDALVVEFDDGALATVGGTGNAHKVRLDLHIHCERGSIEMEMITQTFSLRGPEGRREDHGPLPDRESCYPRRAPAVNLAEVVLGRAANGSPAEAGWRAVELLDAAYRSAGSGGRPVTVAALYDEASFDPISQTGGHGEDH